jgi:nucleoside-diphosphate-sugar epimerase
MKFLLIGGTRFIGPVIVERLLAAGDQVTVLSRGGRRPDWWDRVDHVLVDRTDRNAFARLLKGRSFDGVFDLWAYERADVESSHDVFHGNVGRYLFVSSASVYYGQEVAIDFRTHCPFSESVFDWSGLDYAIPEGAKDEQLYGIKKRQCEKWLQENSRIDYTIIRLPAVMGWNDWTRRMWWWVQRAIDGGPLLMPMEDRACFRTILHADAAENFIRAVKSPAAARQTYHIAQQEIMDDVRWSDAVWRAAGGECPRVYVPWEVIRRREPLREYSPPMTRPVPWVPDLSRAQRDFGLATTPVEQWIATAVQWYRTSYTGVPDRPYNSNGYDNRAAEIALAEEWRHRFGQLGASV